VSYEALLDDLAAVHGMAAEAGRPVFLMGHSLGGQITLRYLLSRQPVCRGGIAASPWLRLAFRPAGWRIALARALRRWWPTFLQPTPWDPAKLSRDPEHLMALPCPELVHHRISARMFLAVVEEGEKALAEAGRLKTPLLLLHGGDDPITSAEATRELFERAGSSDKEMRMYPGTRHETHNDLDRERVLAEVAAWMEARCGAEGGAK
jgi:alpha-beta hydrolase superfamily lysophospholipase